MKSIASGVLAIAAFATSAAAASAVPAPPAPAAAQAGEPLVSAFNDTCRRGFPSIETIRRHAAAQGWIERSARLIPEASDPRLQDMPQPHFLQKGDMMLILSAPNAVSRSHTCSVALSVGKELDTAGLAGLVSQALGAAPAAMTKVRGAERAQWQPAPTFFVEAGVSRKPTRSATILVRTQP